MFPKLYLPKINRPPSLALMAQLAAFTLGAGMIAAVSFGIGAASHPDTPQECTVALNTASRIFIAQSNLVSATQARATRGQDEFAEHDADVERLFAEVDDLTPVFDTAADACLGGAR